MTGEAGLERRDMTGRGGWARVPAACPPSQFISNCLEVLTNFVFFWPLQGETVSRLHSALPIADTIPVSNADLVLHFMRMLVDL